MTALLAMVLLGAGSWLLRVMFILVVPAERIPPKVREALGHLPPAVLAALVAVEASAAASGDDPAIGAVVAASVLAIGLTARLTGSLLLAVLLGGAAALLIDLVLLA
jgi:branched-subunit amino acid transport protein